MHPARVRTIPALLAAAACAHGGGLTGEFYAFDNGTGRDQKLPFEQQADLLARTRYAGMGIYTGTARIPEMLAALDARKLRLVGIYVHSFVDGRAEAIDPGIPQAIRDLSGRDTMILLTLQGHGAGAEERAVENLRRVADLAAESKLRVCLYPHIDFHVETTADALRVARKAGRPNVGVALNLFHTVAFHLSRCGSEDFDMARLIREALPRLFLVSINGITRRSGAAELERLDRGDYDVGRFLSLLDQAGYTGPVALQSYGVKGDLEENLARSMGAWKEMIERIRRTAAAPRTELEDRRHFLAGFAFREQPQDLPVAAGERFARVLKTLALKPLHVVLEQRPDHFRAEERMAGGHSPDRPNQVGLGRLLQ